MERRGRRKVRHMDLADLARLRQAAYRLFSTMLLYPDEERLRTVAAVAGELRDQGDLLATFSFFSQWRELLDTLHGLSDLELTRVQEEYIQVFMVKPEGSPCLPYESAYLEPKGATGWIALEREYAAAGLSLSPSLGEPPDHVAVELEFLYFLCHQEALAWEERRLHDAVETLKWQASFLEQHLGRWFPAFARQVGGTDNSKIYTAVTVAAQTFISHDRDLLKALVERFGCKGQQRRHNTAKKA